MNKWIAPLCIFIAFQTQATEYRFSYSELYSKLKYSIKEEYTSVGTGVYFVNPTTQLPCHIDKSWMEKEQHYEELNFPRSGKLPLPLDDNLKNANPLVYVHTDANNQCDYSVALVANEPYTKQVNADYLEVVIPEFQLLLEDISGMFSSWFAPTVSGVTLEFIDIESGKVALSNGQTLSIAGHRAHITLKDLRNGVVATLPESPSRIMPYIQQ
jgi:hypothetical protein